MKINEACKRTGLSERAIRFYVEKGLITPKSQIINGRTTIEYSQADIELLRDIATLRNAEFSIADILAMQSSDEDVCRMIQKHCAELEQEQVLREELIRELKEISKRQHISWRKLSSILSQKGDDYQWQGVRVAEEESEAIESDKKNFGNGIKRIGKCGVLIFFIVLVIFVFTYNKHNNKILTSYFTIDEVVVEQKWTRNEDYYVSVYSMRPDSDVEEYFKSPRTMQTGAREYYEAMQITGEPYDTFEIRVEIPYADAREEGILDKNGNIVIEKALGIDRVVRDYCFIERIDNN
jgi:DNA-binding transcriptional MerR regulator